MKAFEKIAERSVGSLMLLFGGALCFCASAALATAMLLKDPTPPASERRFDTPMLLAVEGDGCGGCEVFRKTVVNEYRATGTSEKMPVTFVNGDNPRALGSYALKSSKVVPETLILIDRYGREITRTGMHSSASSLQSYAEGYMRRASK
jgi:hypothetical protein